MIRNITDDAVACHAAGSVGGSALDGHDDFAHVCFRTLQT